MSRTEILLQIEELVKKLDEQQRRLQSFPGEIPALESDLLQRQVRQLYEYALALEKCRAEEVVATPSASVREVPVQEAPAAEAPPDTPPVPQHESPVEHILVEAARRAEAPSDMAPATGVRSPKLKGDVNSVLFKDNPTLGDKFDDEPTVHERISSAHTTHSIASHQQKKSISDLRKAIGLNEKFLFINQLFDGNLQVYNQAIEFLDTASGKEAALDYIQNTLVPQFAWNLNSLPARIFVELVERRFLKS